MAPSRAAAALLGCSASLLATGCGDGGGEPRAATAATGPATEPAAEAATVDIASFRFAPRSVTIVAGGSVTWRNRDKAPHTAQSSGEGGAARFATGRLARGQRRSITFSTPGSYPYYCVYHRFMEANVIVR
jgi:plastocyanin